MKKYKFEIGRIYEIEYLDHFDTNELSPEQATGLKETKLKTYGKCVGENKKYIILSWNYENEISPNNDNIHILKGDILKVRELK